MTLRENFPDLGARILSSVALAALGLTCLIIGGGAFAAIVSAATGIVAWESARMHLGEGGRRIPLLTAAAAGAGLLLILEFDSPLPGVFAAAAGLLLCAAGRSPLTVISMVAATTAGLAGLAILREQSGLLPAIFVVACVIAADIGGYFFGRFFGGPKLWPRVSPGKTWSGTGGGWLLAGCVGAAFWSAGLSKAHAVPSALLVAACAQAGDLAESAVKRRAGVKDGSKLIPGHGGLMDRCDGLVGAGCLALALIIAGQTGILGFG